MRVHIDLAGCGTGARKQFKLLKPELVKLGVLFVPEEAAKVIVYWNAYEKNTDRMKQRIRQRKVVCRVGGWHPETAEVTRDTLARAHGIFFVSEADKEYAKSLGWKLSPSRTVIRNAARWVGPNRVKRKTLLIRHGNIGNTLGKKRLDRMYSIAALADVWSVLRQHYPELMVWVVGGVGRDVKKRFSLPGWKYIGRVRPEATVSYGRKAWGLVHMVVSDHCPNSVAEAIGEGCPAIVPESGGAGEIAGSAGLPISLRESKNGTWDVFGRKMVVADARGLFLAVADVLERPSYWQKRCEAWYRRALRPSVVAGSLYEFLRGVVG